MTVLALYVAAQLAITLQAPDTMTLGAPAIVVVEASAPGARAPRISAPSGADFSLLLTGRSSRVSASMGSRWNVVEEQYRLIPRRAGAFVLPPFDATIVGARKRTPAHRIVVRAAPAAAGPPAIIARARLNPGDGVMLRAAASPETVYVGQQSTYQVAVFLDDDVRLRLRRNPEFVPPEPRGMLAYELVPPPAGSTTRIVGGRRYEAHVFQRGIFPLAAGRYVIPQAQLVYSLPLSASFFSREESHTVRADSVVVVAIEPPAAGRPTDWAGAVGDLAVESRVDSSTGRAGDPIVVTLRVTGRGNVKLLPRPALAVPWGTAVPSEERVRLDTASVVVRGAKEFDWLVTPRQSGALELPAIRYPFFNPYTERYEIAVTPARTITVTPSVLASIDSAALADSAPLLPLRPALRAAVPPPAQQRAPFWAVVLLAPVPAAAVGFLRRPRRRPRAVVARAALRALARDRSHGDAARLRRVFVSALAERLDLTPGAITTTRGALSGALRRAGVTTEAAHAVERLLVSLDRAAYSPGAPPPPGAAREAADLFARVEREARSRAALAARRAARPLALVVALAASAVVARGALAGGGDRPSELFARGTAEYGARHFATSAELFSRVADAVPRAGDAWANYGTASWAARDTAAAAVGWQRALRLEPLAPDLRDRLGMLGAPHEGPIASVPRLPRDSLPLAALALWCGAWGCVLAAVWRRGRRFALLRWGMALGAASAVVALTARDLTSRLESRSLAVVAGHAPLRALPALGAERGAQLVPGDVAQVLRREQVWAQVRLDGEREGWIEWDRLTPLDRSTARALAR